MPPSGPDISPLRTRLWSAVRAWLPRLPGTLVIVLSALGFMRFLTGSSQSAARPSQPYMVQPADSAIQSKSAAAAVTTLDLTGLQSRFELVADQVSPSVVAISVAIDSRGDQDTIRPEDMSGRKLTNILDRTTRTVGTGFVISPDGHILTNEHVIGEARQIWCTTDQGRVYPAFVVGSDPRQDLAVLMIPARNLQPVRFAELTNIKRGDWAIALGNPYGLAGEGRLAMAVGVVSATGRSLPRLSTRENRLYADLIQTTAEINPGNSGGPLFNLEGEVFGVNTAVVLPQKNTNGIGFALPITPQLLAHIDEIKQGKEIPYGDLGLTVSQPTAQDRRTAGAPAELGAQVDKIDPGSPCDGVLIENDLITSLGATDLPSADAYATASTALRAGVQVKITVYRAQKRLEFTLMPRRRAAAGISRATQRYQWNGMLLGPIPSNWEFAGNRKPDYGVMVLAAERSPRPTLTPGTIIQGIAGTPIHTVTDLQKVLATTPPDQANVTVWGKDR